MQRKLQGGDSALFQNLVMVLKFCNSVIECAMIMKFGAVTYNCRGGSRGVYEVSGNQSRSDQDTLIEQSITLIKQSQYSEQQCSKLYSYK